MATRLEQTLMRNLREDKISIIGALESSSCIKYTIELKEEPGEVLIIRCMETELIEKTVNKAISLIFPGSKASNVKKYDDCLEFEIN